MLQGQVLALAAASGFLFSGGQDASIRVWAFNPAAGIFVSQVRLPAMYQAGQSMWQLRSDNAPFLILHYSHILQLHDCPLPVTNVLLVLAGYIDS